MTWRVDPDPALVDRFDMIYALGDPPIYAMVSRGRVEMHFGMADGVADVSNVTFRRVGFDAYIWVDDIQGLFEELAASGAKIVEGPIRRIYESTEIEVEDCNGFKIVYGD